MSQTYPVIEVPTDQNDLWDQLIDKSAQGGAFLRSDALRTLAANENPAATLRRLAIPDKEGTAYLAGWAFLVRRRRGLRYSSQFPLFYNGPVLAPPYDLDPSAGSRRIALLHALGRAAHAGIDVIECEAHPSLADLRGLVFADYDLQSVFCHIWKLTADPIWKQFNGTKRNEANRARKTHNFDWLQPSSAAFQNFRHLHDRTLEKFSWNPPAAWRETLTRQTAATCEMGFGRLFAGTPNNEPDRLEAIVSVLLNPPHKTAYLWRVGIDSRQTGLVAALYGNAAEAIRTEYGNDWEINFGGSPRFSLSQFKDYLGAVATAHTAIRWIRPGKATLIWRGGFALKETLLRLRQKTKSRRE